MGDYWGKKAIAGGLLLTVTACTMPDLEIPPVVGVPSQPIISRAQMEAVTFDDLPGWAIDDHGAALASLKQTCLALRRGDAIWSPSLFANNSGENTWADLCAVAVTIDRSVARSFFERAFEPYRIGVASRVLGGLPRKGKLTAYYTPRVRGAGHKRGPYAAPLFPMPAGLTPGDNRYTRKAIASGAIPKSKALVWVDDPVEAFWMQIQGAGDVELANGQTVLMEVEGTNGQKWVSPGSKGLSKQVMKTLYLHEPASAVASLNNFPRYVFYRRSSDGQVRGAAGVPLTPQRSVAVDPRYVPLGTPVYVSTGFGPGALNRLAIAQDVGGAITGSVRADLYMGRGRAVERAAMSINHELDMYALKARPNANFAALERSRTAPLKVAAAQGQMIGVAGGSTDGFRGFGVQLGAFSSLDNAKRAWQGMVQRAAPLLDRILPHMVPAGSIYRLRAGPMDSRAAADGLCARLQRVRIDCFPVSNR